MTGLGMTGLRLRSFGRTGLQVSELGLGALTFGRETDEATSSRMVDVYADHGGNLADTADVYNDSEEVLGRILRGRRDRFVVATKVGLPGAGVNREGASRVHLVRQCEASLRRLGTEWIDLYQLHVWDPLTPLEETFSTLDSLVRSGKVRYVGVSNWAAWQIAKALGVAELRRLEPISSLSPQYNLAERDVERELVPLCLSENVAILPWSPLGGGVLTGKYRPGAPAPEGSRATRASNSTASMQRRLSDERTVAVVQAAQEVAEATGRSVAQVALNWLVDRPGVTAPVIGARTVEQLEQNLGATGWQLTDEQRQHLDAVSHVPLGYPYEWNDVYGIRQGAKPAREIAGVS
jgi:aryl-alcohol dehydrogenase-like predicted oxidoreductase